MVAAGAVVMPGTKIPTGQVWAGSPAKFLRKLTDEEQAFVANSAATYACLADAHKCEYSCFEFGLLCTNVSTPGLNLDSYVQMWAHLV